jgi:hypothetical protein
MTAPKKSVPTTRMVRKPNKGQRPMVKLQEQLRARKVESTGVKAELALGWIPVTHKSREQIPEIVAAGTMPGATTAQSRSIPCTILIQTMQ